MYCKHSHGKVPSKKKNGKVGSIHVCYNCNNR